MTTNKEEMTIKKETLKTEEPKSDSSTSSANIRVFTIYGKCEKNQSPFPGVYIYDGCQEFIAHGEEGTEAALICDACGCNRSFHVMQNEAIDVHPNSN